MKWAATITISSSFRRQAGIAIGDISGKGIGAAMMMANLEACLRGQAPSAGNLPELMRRVNQMVYEASSAEPLRHLLLCRIRSGRPGRWHTSMRVTIAPVVLRVATGGL